MIISLTEVRRQLTGAYHPDGYTLLVSAVRAVRSGLLAYGASVLGVAHIFGVLLNTPLWKESNKCNRW